MARLMKTDDHEIVALSRALSRSAAPVLRDVTAVVERGAVNIKKDAARRISGLAHARAYPRSITYDTHMSFTGPSADIGPDKDRPQGALGNLLEYGSINNPPHPHMKPAADAELPKFEKALENLAVKALGIE